MPRKRMIDPSIWFDEGLVTLPPRAQFAYVGMFSNADDDGRLKGSASHLKMVLPIIYRDVPVEDVEGDIRAVVSTMGQLVRYEAAGTQYLVFLNFRKWQKIERPTDSILPPPPDGPPPPTPIRGALTETSPTALQLLAPNRKEEKRKESNRRPSDEGAANAPSGWQGPLFKAFDDLSLPRPLLAEREGKRAKQLMELGTADELASCWKEYANGYGDTFGQENLSFNFLFLNNRFANWREKQLGKRPTPPQGGRHTQTRNGMPTQGRASEFSGLGTRRTYQGDDGHDAHN